MRTKVMLALAVLLVFGAAAAQAGAPPSKTTARVFTLPDFAPVADASSSIVRTDRGANFSLRTSGLPARHAIRRQGRIIEPNQLPGLVVLDANANAVSIHRGRALGDYPPLGEVLGELGRASEPAPA